MPVPNDKCPECSDAAGPPRKEDKTVQASPFRSILFPSGLEGTRAQRSDQPGCFVDLNLDLVVAGVVAKRNEEVLRPIFYCPYRNEEIVRYRQAVFADLEQPEVFPIFPVFCEAMRAVRANLAYADRSPTSAIDTW